MKLFTFSGIRAHVVGTNPGTELAMFARDLIGGLPAAFQPEYTGTKDIDHFSSDVNLGKIFTNLQSLVTLDGRYELDQEASIFGPRYAKLMSATTGDDGTVLILAHSQGCNNLAHALQWLREHEPAFLRKKTVRCALFDPKVAPNRLGDLMASYEKSRLGFLFFQSENDLLDNQSILRNKFIDQFEVGDHLWVRATNHSTICQWAVINEEQGMLSRPKYLQFRRNVRLKRMALAKRRTKPGLGPEELPKFAKYIREYPVLRRAPSLALKGFLQGELAALYQS